MLKLGKRLTQIQQLVPQDYSHIWDCCCDHGWLGMSLLAKQTAPHIHFVDIVPELMSKVDDTLDTFFADSPSSWKTYCLDVAKLPLAQHSGRQLVIIAGVGGDLMIEFIHQICQRHPQLTIEFLLCPVHHQFALREALITRNFSLQDERLIEENKRFYEILLVSTQQDDKHIISPVGDKMWRCLDANDIKTAQSYLKKTISHYQRVHHTNPVSSERAIALYNAIKIRNEIIE